MSLFNAIKVAGKALGALAITEKVTEGVMEMTEVRNESGTPTIIEEIEVEAHHVLKRVHELIREGNVRTLRIKDKKGKYLLEIPLTWGIVAGGAFAFTSPWTVALSALGIFLMDVKIEIERTIDGPDGDSSPDIE